jgi:hypothetical protein
MPGAYDGQAQLWPFNTLSRAEALRTTSTGHTALLALLRQQLPLVGTVHRDLTPAAAE